MERLLPCLFMRLQDQKDNVRNLSNEVLQGAAVCVSVCVCGCVVRPAHVYILHVLSCAAVRVLVVTRGVGEHARSCACKAVREVHRSWNWSFATCHV